MRWPIAAYMIESLAIVRVFVFPSAIVREDGMRIADKFGGTPFAVEAGDGLAISETAARIGVYSSREQARAVLLPRLRAQLADAPKQYATWRAHREAELRAGIEALEGEADGVGGVA